ncbi:unnamed protein product, partial [Allacma fusca]
KTGIACENFYGFFRTTVLLLAETDPSEQSGESLQGFSGEMPFCLHKQCWSEFKQRFVRLEKPELTE